LRRLQGIQSIIKAILTRESSKLLSFLKGMLEFSCKPTLPENNAEVLFQDVPLSPA